MKKIALAVILTCLISSTTNAKTMNGAFIRANGYSPTDMMAFESDVNKDMAIINLFTSFDFDWNTLYVQSSNVVAQGGTPMITLEPTVALRHNDNLLPEILAGSWDAYLDQWIADFKAWVISLDDPDARILMRFAHEFNGIWYPWSNDPANFILAWRYIHDKFEAAGANQYVEWVWCANNVDVDDYNDITVYYPGDDYVDWTSIDGYNWGSNFSFTQWNTFTELFEEKYDLLMANYPSLPIIIGEVASAEPTDLPDPLYGQDGDDSDNSEDKGEWIDDMFHQLRSKFHGIKGFAWFNINKELSWSINEAANNTGVTDYKKGVKPGYFKGEFSPAESYVHNGMLVGVGNSVQSQANGFRQLPQAAIDHRRAMHHQMIANQ